MRKLILPRGISRSGKSTFSKEMQKYFSETEVFSTDRYFYDNNWNYNFDYRNLHSYHQKNLHSTQNAIRRKVQIIIVDNTNLLNKDYTPYIDEAKKYNYQIVGVNFIPRSIDEHFKENIHNIPKENIQNMLTRFHNKSESDIFKKIVNEFYEISPEQFFKNISDVVEQILQNSIK